ncbi:unnamed protein product [Camellia sinensis]
MVENEHSLRTANLTDDDMIRDFPDNFKSYVKNHQLLYQRGDYDIGWVFWSCEHPPLPPLSVIINGTLIAPPIPEFMEKTKSCCKRILTFWRSYQFLLHFWKVIEIEGKRFLTTRHQPFGFNEIRDGLCSYRLMSLDYEFDVDGVSEEHLGLLGCVFRHQQLESTPNVQYYSCNEYPQHDRAVSFNIKPSLAVPLFESSTRCCIGVIEMVSTTEITTRYLEICHYKRILRTRDYTEGRDPRIALVPLLTTMKQHCKSFKAASGEELGEGLSIEVLDFSGDDKLYSNQIPQTVRTPNRMENGEEMVWLDLFNQQLLEVDAIDIGNNRLQRKAGIPISLDDLQQHFGMKLKDVAESLGVSRSIVKRACREYNITRWSPCKRSKDNQLLSNKLVQGGVQEQILESGQPPIFDPPHMQDMATASHTKPHFTAAQDTSIATVKAKYGDFIKFQLHVSSGMVEFQQQVAKRLNLQGGTYRVKYQDEDNDWILIACDEDLQNYICNSISQGRNKFKMLIQPITNCPS